MEYNTELSQCLNRVFRNLLAKDQKDIFAILCMYKLANLINEHNPNGYIMDEDIKIGLSHIID